MATSPILRAAPATLRRRRQGPKQTSLTLFPTAARHGTCEQPSDASAPPEPVPTESGSPLRTKPATELVGIARLAASSLRAEAKRGTEYFLLPVRSILNYCDSERVPFRWTVNPYRGCEFGCKYCYARYTHEYMDIDGGEFESKIYVKKDAGALVRSRSLHGENLGRTYRDWDGYRSLPAGRARVRSHARDSGKNGGARGAESFDYDEIRSGGSRYRFAAAHRGTIIHHGESEHHHIACAPGAASRASRAEAGSAAWRRFASCARLESPRACWRCQSCRG